MTNNCLKDMTERVSRGHIYIQNKNIGFFKARSIIDTGFVEHGFTGRTGGVSEGPYDSLNFSLSRPDNMQNVKKNYELMAYAANFEPESIAIVSYEHGDGVCRVSEKDRGSAPNTSKSLPPCDGIITNDPLVTLVTLHADCGALFFVDPKNRAVGLAHAGWRGTLLRIAAKVVSAMQNEFGSQPEDIIAAAGPCICGECYEVDEELAAKFINEFKTENIIRRKCGKSYLDMSLCVLIQLAQAGVNAKNITLFDACTYEMKESFFSYRRDKGQTGAMAAFMRIKS
ncbi:MAG: peptidoglycan editing factor PgeF [Clostridia bacterium]|nr:peptidoglycan editing factor PgeF [Clostridia bacterium]